SLTAPQPSDHPVGAQASGLVDLFAAIGVRNQIKDILTLPSGREKPTCANVRLQVFVAISPYRRKRNKSTGPSA
ncbi:MAG: hypothetical protein JJU20_12510, partial [Opitutales bacterium]|nr:hypothetical protein [Opitutales bacterium]